ncbi:glycosyltransferase [Mycoplasmopsis cynos]|uniref:glycosyltransferase n=1 Tax=Mycoplasmopsis cynos TaxID=171284 RepID=UPI0021F9A041|nr:glycosyltransferase [Mycoplasmopsis cynos]UWV81652.1 glycosyltransferase [Mycoplasmopsis cynos]
MKLSLVSLVTKNVENVKKYLDSLLSQTSNDFEIILCLNGKESENKQIISLLTNYFEKFKNRLQVIYNSKTNSYQYNLLSAFKLARGEYITVFNTDITLIKYYYIENMIKNAEKYNVDVLEFKPRLNGSISWKPKARLINDRRIDLAKNPLPFAYVFPFIFNKIFKKSLVQKVMKFKLKNTNDTKLCIELNYILLFEAKSYTYLDFKIYREYFPADMWLNSKRVLNIFDELEKYLLNMNRKLFEEITYAKYYFLKLLMTDFLKETSFTYKNIYKTKEEIHEKRSKLLLAKHLELLEKLERFYKAENYLLTNPYFSRNNEEVTLMLFPISKEK